MSYDASQSMDWSAMSAAEFENRVTALLQRVHPEGHRLDGAGGDGGIDFVIAKPGGDVVFQVKHFPGRLIPRRKRQIKESFERATRNRLSGWFLVVPIDLTVKERKWLNELTSTVPPHDPWRGLGWLDDQLAAHPDLRFSWMQQGAARAMVRDRLHEIGNGVVSLDDVIKAQADVGWAAATLSPTLAIFPASSPQGTVMEIRPKPGAPPIIIDISAISAFAGADGAESLSWGKPTAFTAPASVIGLPDDVFGSSLLHFELEGVPSPPVEFELQAIASTRTVASLRFPATTAPIGPAGAEFETSDRSGWLHLVVKATAGRFDVTHTVDANTPAYPEDIVQVVRFINRVRDAADALRLVVTVDNGKRFSASEPLVPANREELIGAGFERYISDLAWLQNYCGTFTKVDIDVVADAGALHDMVAQLRGETVQHDGTLDARIRITDRDNPMHTNDEFALVVRGALEKFEHRGTIYPLPGHVHQVACAHARLIDRDFEAAGTDSDCRVRLEPAEGHYWNLTVGRVSTDSPGG